MRQPLQRCGRRRAQQHGPKRRGSSFSQTSTTRGAQALSNFFPSSIANSKFLAKARSTRGQASMEDARAPRPKSPAVRCCASTESADARRRIYNGVAVAMFGSAMTALKTWTRHLASAARHRTIKLAGRWHRPEHATIHQRRVPGSMKKAGVARAHAGQPGRGRRRNVRARARLQSLVSPASRKRRTARAARLDDGLEEGAGLAVLSKGVATTPKTLERRGRAQGLESTWTTSRTPCSPTARGNRRGQGGGRGWHAAMAGLKAGDVVAKLNGVALMRHARVCRARRRPQRARSSWNRARAPA